MFINEVVQKVYYCIYNTWQREKNNLFIWSDIILSLVAIEDAYPLLLKLIYIDDRFFL